MSLDGYIATQEDDLSFLSVVAQEGEDYGYAKFIDTIDTYLIGRTTYDVVRKLMNNTFPQAKQFDCYVITRQHIDRDEGVTFYNGSLVTLIAQLKQAPGKDIFCDGGAEIVTELLTHRLIDEFVISIIPTLIGSGKRLFKEIEQTHALRLTSCVSFPSGLVQVRYERVG